MSSFVRWVTVLALATLALLALIWLTQRRLIYFPTQSVPDPHKTLPGIEEVTFRTEDDLTLAAWFVPAIDDEFTATVVVFNGNAGNRADRVPLAGALAEKGFSVLLVDYRGYGGNPGSPSEQGLASDARAAIEYLKTRNDVDRSRLVYFGESLGAAVALGLAGQEPPAALVLRSPFTSLADIATTHYPFLPTSLLLWDRYPNKEIIGGVAAPVMVIAGSADTIVPFEQSRELFETAPEPKQLLVVDGADHNDYALLASELMVNEMEAFLEEVLRQG